MSDDPTRPVDVYEHGYTNPPTRLGVRVAGSMTDVVPQQPNDFENRIDGFVWNTVEHRSPLWLLTSVAAGGVSGGALATLWMMLVQRISQWVPDDPVNFVFASCLVVAALLGSITFYVQNRSQQIEVRMTAEYVSMSVGGRRRASAPLREVSVDVERGELTIGTQTLRLSGVHRNELAWVERQLRKFETPDDGADVPLSLRRLRESTQA